MKISTVTLSDWMTDNVLAALMAHDKRPIANADSLLPQSPALRRSQTGFTMVELIVTMILIGIMSAVAIPRISSLGTFNARGFRDQTIATLRFAQKTAIAQRRAVCVAIGSTGTGVTLTIATSDTKTICSNAADFVSLTPPFSPKAGSGLSGSDFTFLRIGETSQASGSITLTITDADPITIDAVTGYVR